MHKTKKPIKEPDQIKQMAQRFAALADPTRLRIAISLRGGEKYVDQLADEVERHQSVVSRHCKRLTDAGITERFVAFGFAHYRLSREGKKLVDAVLGGSHQSSTRASISDAP